MCVSGSTRLAFWSVLCLLGYDSHRLFVAQAPTKAASQDFIALADLPRNLDFDVWYGAGMEIVGKRSVHLFAVALAVLTHTGSHRPVLTTLDQLLLERHGWNPTPAWQQPDIPDAHCLVHLRE